jgi:hypothetical protein
MDYRHVYTPKLLGCPIMFDPTVMITVIYVFGADQKYKCLFWSPEQKLDKLII